MDAFISIQVLPNVNRGLRTSRSFGTHKTGFHEICGLAIYLIKLNSEHFFSSV